MVYDKKGPPRGELEQEGGGELLEPKNLPTHIAIIMDGNGRWAQQKSMPRIEGHREGAKAVRRTVEACRELGIRNLTLYAFSAENWGRPQEEVQGLMDLLKDYLKSELQEMLENNIRLMAIGSLERLPVDVQEILYKDMEMTRECDRMTLTLALSYSGREEILKAVNSIASEVARGNHSKIPVTSEQFSQYLSTHFLPDPDLLIRTSGEIRISNFFLWQLAYSEIYFTRKCWPDFQKSDLVEAIQAYQKRQRRFGLTAEQTDPLKDSTQC